MQLNKINPSVINEMHAKGNAGERMGEGVYKNLLKTENKPLTAQLNKARAAFLASMLHKTIKSNNESINQSNNGVSKQMSYKGINLLLKSLQKLINL